MKLKPQLLAAATLLALASAGASAATYDLSQGPFDQSVNKFTNTPFTDIFDFTFGKPPGGTVSSSAIEVKLGKFIDIAWDKTNAFSIYAGLNGSGTLLKNFGDPGVSTGSFFVEDLPVNSNVFSVVLKGTPVGNGLSTNQPGLKGHYDLNVVAQPVPEPGTVSLMMAGLAGVGFIARRRREKKDVA